jgi:crotonobetainyl-CoA:carnitine CoA-transferase CaiB-like acyl-CoA transferase
MEMMLEGSESCLAGMKIVDLSQFEAGPSCTESLAWMGAEVVKIENPKGGDPMRGSEDDIYHFYQFLQYNANKRSLSVNLKDPRGLELVKDMVRTADVVVENFAPNTIERLGLGPDELMKINPGLIYCRIKGFGEGSRFEHNLAFDMIAQACGGLMSVTGNEDGPPCKPGASLGDTGSGMLLAISILGAYIRKLRTGQGELLEVAMQDAILHYIRNAFTYMESSGKVAPRSGSRIVGGGCPPNGAYPCKGGGPNDYVYIYTSFANPEHWDRLLRLMGRDDLLGDERYSTNEGRTARPDEVDAIVSEWTRKHDKMSAMEMLGEAKIAAGAVMDTMELANDQNFIERGIRQTIQHPEAGAYTMSGWPVRFGGSTLPVTRAPLLGEHNRDVLERWLNLDVSVIASLESDKVIG